MNIITVASQKGGVGKTTVALNLGYALALHGWKTLIVDVDPQGSLGLCLTRKVSSAHGLADYLLEERSLAEVVIQTRVPQLQLLSVGHLTIDRVVAYEEAIQAGGLYNLIEACGSSFELVILDTASGFGPCTLGSLCASTHLLVPLQAEPAALRSFPKILEWISWLHNQNVPVQLLGVLLTMLDSGNPFSTGVAEEMKGRFPPELLLEPAVPRDSVFLEANAAGVPVGLLRRVPPPVARVFDQIATLVAARLGLRETGVQDGPLPFVD